MDRLKQSLLKLGKSGSQAFTLIELLIVIGILGVLAVTVLLTLNPAEAQRKARDVQRQRDATTIQSIVEQALGDGLNFCSTTSTPLTTATTPCRSNLVPGGGVIVLTQQPCQAGANWMGIDVCDYAKNVPADPMNNRNTFCHVSNATGTAFTRTANCQMEYMLNVSGVDYEINYKQESESNARKLFMDVGTAAGNNFGNVEIFTAVHTLIGAAVNY